jgi:glutathione S-transferase
MRVQGFVGHGEGRTAMSKVCGMTRSGNCWTVSQILRLAGQAFEWIETDTTKGDTATPAFEALNPHAEVPVVVLEDGAVLTQSNAILAHFAEATRWLPAAGLLRTWYHGATSAQP